MNEADAQKYYANAQRSRRREGGGSANRFPRKVVRPYCPAACRGSIVETREGASRDSKVTVRSRWLFKSLNLRMTPNYFFTLVLLHVAITSLCYAIRQELQEVKSRINSNFNFGPNLFYIITVTISSLIYNLVSPVIWYSKCKSKSSQSWLHWVLFDYICIT